MINFYERPTDSEGYYIPYLTFAEAEADRCPTEAFVRSLFPEATDEQIAMLKLDAIARILDGIAIGLQIAGRDSIGEIDAYQLGVREGLDRGNQNPTR